VKVALLGSAGQLGRDLAPRLGGEVAALTRVQLDLDRSESVAAYFAANRPDLVVNCAAYNLVDKAEADPGPTFQANAWGVEALAKACAKVGAKLVHVSSDYVFGLGDIRRPLTESDPPGPVSNYGLSKFAGECLARTHAPRHLVIRSCGLYGVWGTGGKGGNFVETMLRLAGQGKPLRVVSDQHCTPTFTADLADAVVKLIAADAEGLFHLTSAGATTWHDLAAEVFHQTGTRADLTPIISAEFNAPARRPAFSVLDCGKAAALGVTLRPWQEALAAYLAERSRKPA
jgi:dTDP-4-dehydrorhamnose reductase